jgi:ankyrin repeat protein
VPCFSTPKRSCRISSNPKTPLPLDKMLWDAMYMRKLGLFTLLVESGADVNATGEEGRTLLQEASDRDDILFVQRLLRLGADVNRTNNAGDTALSLALSRGNKETAQLLLNKGAVVRQQDFMNFHAIFPPPRNRSR